MTTISISPSSTGALSQTDLHKLQEANDGDTVKLGSKYSLTAKTYTVSKSDDNVQLQSQGHNKPGAQRDLLLSSMNIQLRGDDSRPNQTTFATLSFNEANKQVNDTNVARLAAHIKSTDADVVLISEQESKGKGVANRIAERLGYDVIDVNTMLVMTKPGKFGKTALTVLAKPGVDVAVLESTSYRDSSSKNKGGAITMIEVDGLPMKVAGVHLDSNSEAKRSKEINAIFNNTTPETEKIAIGDHNTRSNGNMRPLSDGSTGYANHNMTMKALDDDTYNQIDSKTGQTKHKSGRECSDSGELDGTLKSNVSGRIHSSSDLVLHNVTGSDHKAVLSTFTVAGQTELHSNPLHPTIQNDNGHQLGVFANGTVTANLAVESGFIPPPPPMQSAATGAAPLAANGGANSRQWCWASFAASSSSEYVSTTLRCCP